MAEINNVPAIRFKYFSDGWSIEKFESLTKINQGLQIAISQRYIEEIDGGYFYITNEFLKENSNSKYYILNPPESVLCNHNDVLMTRTGNTGVVVTNISGAFHNNFFKIKFNEEKIEKNFLVTFLRLPKTQKIILASAGASTIPDLNHSAFYNIEITYPDLTEQGLLGSYFQHLDKLISLHQTKVNKLTNLKKAMLEKMFPKHGADEPEIRFKGFAGAWDEKTVGGIFDDLKGTGLSKEKIGNHGKYKCILYGHLFTKFSEVIDAIDSRTDCYEGVLSKENDILMPSSTTTTGIDLAKASSLKESGVLLGGDIIILRMKEQGSSDFFAYYLTYGVNKKIAEVTQGTTIIHLYFSGLKDVLLKVPCPAEQALIGAYFQNLDKTITLHQTELEKLNNLKKSCLEKMFV